MMTGLNVNVVEDFLCKHIQLPERSSYIKAPAGVSDFLSICFMKYTFHCNSCYFSFTFISALTKKKEKKYLNLQHDPYTFDSEVTQNIDTVKQRHITYTHHKDVTFS